MRSEEVGQTRTFEQEVAPKRLQAARRSKMAKSASVRCEWEWGRVSVESRLG